MNLRPLLLALLSGVAILVNAQQPSSLKFDAATLQGFVTDWANGMPDSLLQSEATDRLKLSVREISSAFGLSSEKVHWLDLPNSPNLEFRLEISLVKSFDPTVKPKHPELGDMEKYTLVSGTTFCWSSPTGSYFTVPLEKAKGNWGILVRILARSANAGSKEPWHRAELGVPFASVNSDLWSESRSLALLAPGAFSYTLES